MRTRLRNRAMAAGGGRTQRGTNTLLPNLDSFKSPSHGPGERGHFVGRFCFSFQSHGYCGANQQTEGFMAGNTKFLLASSGIGSNGYWWVVLAIVVIWAVILIFRRTSGRQS